MSRFEKRVVRIAGVRPEPSSSWSVASEHSSSIAAPATHTTGATCWRFTIAIVRHPSNNVVAKRAPGRVVCFELDGITFASSVTVGTEGG